jgi:hypothetical protein
VQYYQHGSVTHGYLYLDYREPGTGTPCGNGWCGGWQPVRAPAPFECSLTRLPLYPSAPWSVLPLTRLPLSLQLHH